MRINEKFHYSLLTLALIALLFLVHLTEKQIVEQEEQIAYLQTKLAEKIQAEEDMQNQFATLYSITQKAINEASECRKWRNI